MINSDILASTYILLDNAQEDELDIAIALEQLASVLNMMEMERVYGNVSNIITKAEFSYSSTGIVTNTILDFGRVVYLEFNNEAIEECPIGMLEQYRTSGFQRVAFWMDEMGTAYAELAIPQSGILKVWYEPEVPQTPYTTATVNFKDSLRWCIASRLAIKCLPYVKFHDPVKMANRAVIHASLKEQASEWKEVYLEIVNRIGTDRPFSRLPFQSGIMSWEM